ncbi:nucleotide disphospho-sugar-binding domain-containing protein [Actinomadura terrae]|uniref:nucleotide disphospho-sugar-binding domain-containing protein n=1 Tax=Actinomadura terrae TaxID=604353 RepID=UPI001FA7537C|nr:nucleotide disphospho-sugar-binding domain-containing protein [Actinomadura terrae]
MRVLFTIYPNSLAHLYPIVPLAWALQSAGHEVRVASHHSAAEQIISTGLSPVQLGDTDVAEVRLTDEANPPKTPEEVDRYTGPLGLDDREREFWITFYQYLFVPMSDYVRVDRSEAEHLVDFCRAWKPDLVLWDVTVPAGAVAARACGAAHARLCNGEDVLAYSLEKLAEREAQVRAAGLDPNPLATLLSPLAEKYGMEIDKNLLLGDFTVDTIPDGMQLPANITRVHMRHIPYAGAQEFPEWLRERPERPRVAMSLGESTRRFVRGDWDRTPKIMKALDGLDVEVVATLNDLQLDGVEKIPENVRQIEWVNLTHLLPTCSAMIHHGGIGTYSAAVPAKVPHLVCDIEGESLMLKPVQEQDASRTGTLLPGLEIGKREDREADGPPPVFELPAKKVEATPVSNFVISKGSGARLDHRAQSVEEMRELIRTVATDESYKRGAEAVHEQWLATPSPADVVVTLERIAAERRGRA